MDEDTKSRILAAAEALFAEKGYAAVSVREITHAAGVNLAAVNYHFGGKENLYLEVFRSRWLPRAARLRTRLEELEERGDYSVEDVVSALLRSFLDHPFWGDDRLRHVQLIVREMARRSEAFQLLLDSFWRPMVDLLVRLLDHASGGELSRQRLVVSAFSILGATKYFASLWPVIAEVAGAAAVEDDELEDVLLAELTGFLVRGLGRGEAS